MDGAVNLSHACLVLTADPPTWRGVLRPGVTMACLDGRNLRATWVDASQPAELEAEAALALLEYGAVIVADLVGMHARVFDLISWLAGARPDSVLLVRHGETPLPFHVRDLAVRLLDQAETGRVGLAELVVAAARRRREVEPLGRDLTDEWANPGVQRRRERSGVAAALR
ncbi:MAG: hypothetical protein O2894_10030, partial [Planctomycetota bacterium]|nr:hypothetical protein [Planctomycetota bacterium]